MRKKPSTRKKTSQADVSPQSPVNQASTFKIVAVIVVVIVAIELLHLGYGWGSQWWSSGDDEAVPVVVDNGPSEEIQKLVSPITKALVGDHEKALKVYRCYTGFAKAMAGPSGKRVDGTELFEKIHGTVLEDLSMAGGPSIGGFIDEVIAAHVGTKKVEDGWEPRSFTDDDRKKLVAILQGIAWSAEQALN